jgi:hypothetical protein
MRLAFLIGFASVLCAGCAGTRPSPAPNSPPQRIGIRTNSTPVTVSPATNTPATGRISHVNTGGQFVILTYPLGKLPPVGTKLSVYRDGMKVGELKVTEPQRDQNTAADITAGEGRAGDETRLH